jgi:hypothetical protein
MSTISSNSTVSTSSAAGAVANGEIRPMTSDRVSMAMGVLQKYKEQKENLTKRLIENDKWFKLKQWEIIKEKSKKKTNLHDIEPKSGWLFNTLLGKSADMMAAFPEPNVLPRESNDEEEGRRLSKIIPVILDQNKFKRVYKKNAWSKNVLGGAIYGTMYDHGKLNGLGDISITSVDPLALYWQPGIEDIQDSRNVFYVSLVDHDVLVERFPEMTIPLAVDTADYAPQYKAEDEMDTTGKALVVDWYYKKYVTDVTDPENMRRRETVQFCQFVGQQVLYATEDDPELSQRGIYDDAQYPFVFDILWPIPGSLWGIGLVDIAKSPQEVIDLLGQQIVKNAIMGSTPRFLKRSNSNINPEEFADYTLPFINVEGAGELGADIQPIRAPLFTPAYMSVLQMKIDEMKFTTGNMDVVNGGTSGSTAASAIMAQIEVAGRSSKDAIDGTYTAYNEICLMVIERIRQFYDLPRQFRITGPNGQIEYIEYNNRRIQTETDGANMIRKPLFDISVKAAKQTAYSRLAQNEMILDFFNRGFFRPELAEQASMAIEMMDFPGKEELLQKIKQQSMLMQILQNFIQMALSLAAKYEPQIYQGMAQQVMGLQQSGLLGGMHVPGMMPGAPGEQQMGGTPADLQRAGMSPGTKGAMTKMDKVKERVASASQPG